MYQKLDDRLVEFAVKVIDLQEALPNNYVCFHLGRQILRSGTSVTLNYGEAQQAASKPDFINKMKIALKELSETKMILRIFEKKAFQPSEQIEALLKEVNELRAIFISSIRTAQGR